MLCLWGGPGRSAGASSPPYLTSQYDRVGRVIRQTQADGTTYQFAYTLDPAGKVSQTDVTDPAGHVRRAAFNGDGYCTSDTKALGLPEGQPVTYARQAGSNLLTSVTDALAKRCLGGAAVAAGGGAVRAAAAASPPVRQRRQQRVGRSTRFATMKTSTNGLATGFPRIGRTRPRGRARSGTPSNSPASIHALIWGIQLVAGQVRTSTLQSV